MAFSRFGSDGWTDEPTSCASSIHAIMWKR